MKFWILLAILAVAPGPTFASQGKIQRYFVPVERMDTIPANPLKALPKNSFVEVTNFYGGGPFDARVVEFHKNSRGLYERGTTSRVNRLAQAHRQRTGGATKCSEALSEQAAGQLFVNMILGGGLRTGLENQAMGEMQGRRYIEAERRKQFSPTSFEEAPEGRIQLESVSWMTTQEVFEYFGKVPWERVAEVEGPAGLRDKDLKKAIDRGDRRFRIKIRRATMILSAGQYHSAHAESGQLYFQNLPWQNEGNLAQRYPISRFGTEKAQPFIFELRRTTQMRGADGEAADLAAFAAVIALHQTYSQPVYGWSMGFPPQEAMVYVHSLKASNTALYERLLAAKVIPELADPNDTVMHVTLADLLVALKALNIFESFREPFEMGLAQDPQNYLSLLSTMEMARMNMRRDEDFYLGGEQLNPNGPLILRLPPSLQRKSLESRISTWEPQQKEWARRVLSQADPIEGQRNFGDPTEDFRVDVIKVLGREATYLSGLDPSMAARDKNYVLRILLLHKRFLKMEFFGETPFLFSVKNPNLLFQFEALGLKPEKTEGDIKHFVLRPSDFQKIQDSNPEVWKRVEEAGRVFTDSRWRQVRLIRDLVGI